MLYPESGIIKASFFQGTKKESGKIGIIFDGKENMGFYKIKKVLFPIRIIYMVAEEMSPERSLRIINKSFSNNKTFQRRKGS